MKCLWLTRQDPRSADSGELLYSLGLIRSLAEAGAQVTVLSHAREGGLTPIERSEPAGERGGVIHWKFVSPCLRFRPLSLLSPLPSDAFRLASTEMRGRLRALLGEQCWDFALIDHAAMAWALDEVRRPVSRLRPPPSIVYVSHNHESETRRHVASQFAGGLAMRFLLLHDAAKYRALEQRICAHADLVSAITPDDLESYKALMPERPVLSLVPGYGGARPPTRIIDRDTPRTVLFLGSFQWLAKRMNLRRFVEAAESVFKARKIRLQVVGKADLDFVRSIVESRDWCRFAANVRTVTPFLERARLGVIAEESGGGFKLKALDYLFHHLPIAALKGNLPAGIFREGDDFLGARSMADLADVIARHIDDLPTLNALKDRAHAKHAGSFDWPDRGARLLDAMEEAGFTAITAGARVPEPARKS